MRGDGEVVEEERLEGVMHSFTFLYIFVLCKLIIQMMMATLI